MKKFIVLSFAFILCTSFNSKAQSYSDGYSIGFSFATQYIDDMVAQHPEYGIIQNGDIYYNQIPGSSNFGFNIPSYLPVSFGSSSYSANQAGQVVVNHLVITGAFDYLLQQSFISDYHLGNYDGFCAGIAQWLLTH